MEHGLYLGRAIKQCYSGHGMAGDEDGIGSGRGIAGFLGMYGGKFGLVWFGLAWLG